MAPRPFLVGRGVCHRAWGKRLGEAPFRTRGIEATKADRKDGRSGVNAGGLSILRTPFGPL